MRLAPAACSIEGVPILSTAVPRGGTGRMSSLSSAVSILRLFSIERSDLSVTEASRLLAIPKSSAHRLIRSMVDEGLLAPVGGTSRYRIGPLPFELSRIFERCSTLMDLIDAELSAVCRQSGHTGYISIIDGPDILVLRVHVGTQTLRVVTPLGSRSPAFETANGRVLLARLEDRDVRALYGRALKPRSPSSPKTINDLLAALDVIRRTGSAEAVDEGVPGVGSVAVSVTDPEGAEAMGFCVSFPAHTVAKTERKRLARTLTESATRIAAQTGDPFWLSRRSPQGVAA